MHFDSPSVDSHDTNHSDGSGSRNTLPDVSSCLESTQVSLGTGDSDVLDTPDSGPPSHPPQNSPDRNLVSQGSEENSTTTRGFTRAFSDLSIAVAAYDFGRAKPRAYPLLISDD